MIYFYDDFEVVAPPPPVLNYVFAFLISLSVLRLVKNEKGYCLGEATYVDCWFFLNFAAKSSGLI
jgi:hypothetical protein